MLQRPRKAELMIEICAEKFSIEARVNLAVFRWDSSISKRVNCFTFLLCLVNSIKILQANVLSNLKVLKLFGNGFDSQNISLIFVKLILCLLVVEFIDSYVLRLIYGLENSLLAL